MTAFDVFIPARYGSTRLPGKMLADLGGQPMIRRVYDAARGSSAGRVVVATDDRRIAEVVESVGGTACMTRGDHASGTDRIAEAVALLDVEDERVIVNVQGDEPLMPPELIDQVAAALEGDPGASIATACTPIDDDGHFRDPSVVKVVLDHIGRAMYFSRAPIPHVRDPGSPPRGPERMRHIGIYAYRAGFLRDFSALPSCALERSEQLEQLRALWFGHRIAVCVADRAPPLGVDTEKDLAGVRALFTLG
jgi:3-deoxy-manno-octulosonate cytidylyltransferase (CMP-KDO synthetase)